MNSLLNSVLFSSILFSFHILIKHFQAKVSISHIFIASIQIFNEIYGLAISRGFVENALKNLFVPDFFRRLLFLRKPSMPSQIIENPEEYQSFLDFSLRNPALDPENIKENSSVWVFKNEMKAFFQKKPQFVNIKHKEPEKNNENKEKKACFSPRLKKVDWNSPGFRVLNRNPEENLKKPDLFNKKPAFLKEISIEKAHEMHYFRTNSSKHLKSEKIRKKSPDDFMKDLKDLKEILTSVHQDLKKTFFRVEKSEETEKNGIIEKKEVISEEKMLEKSENMKFPALDLTENRKKLRIIVEEGDLRKENEENHDILEEIKKVLLERDRDELMRFKKGEARDFLRKYDTIIRVGSSSPDERIKELEGRINEKKERLRVYLKSSENKLRKKS